MSIQDKQDHVEKAIARLPRQFIDSTNLVNIISLTADRFQKLNNAFVLLKDSVSLSTATGKQLDNIGTYLNLVRVSGETDTSYRARLFAQTSALARSGEPEHVIDVFTLLTSATSVTYKETYPAGIQLTALAAVDYEDPDIDSAIFAAMNSVKAGGVSIILIMSVETDYFYFDDEANADAFDNGTISAIHGLGSEIDVDAGKLSRLIS